MFQFKPISLDNIEEIKKACLHAQQFQTLYVFIGFSGAGKSFAINYYHSRHSWVYKITLGPSIKGKAMYTDFLNALTGEELIRNESTSVIIKLIRMEMENVHGNGLIIIDECGNFQKEQIAILKELRDLTDSKFGMVLFGPQDFFIKIKMWAAKGVFGIEEFKTRVYDWIKLKRPRDEEIEALLSENGIMKYKGAKDLLKKQISKPRKDRDWRSIQIDVQKFFDTKPVIDKNNAS